MDTDYVTDNWIPRVWEFKFGSLLWATNVHELWQGSVKMDMRFDPDGASITAGTAGHGSCRVPLFCAIVLAVG